jgi:hypothetical protein
VSRHFWGLSPHGAPALLGRVGARSRSFLKRQRRRILRPVDHLEETLIIAAAAMLVGSSGLSFAGSATKGASGSAPGTQMNNSTTTTSRGASEFAPGDRMKDSTTGRSKGASELTPGDTMNDLRKKK